MSFFGPPNIVKLEAKRNVKGLIKAMGYLKDISIRRKAVEALGRIGDGRAIKPFISALEDKDASARINVVKALGRIGGEEAARPLIPLLKDEDLKVRISATEALAGMGDEKTAQLLISNLDDKDSSVRCNLAQVLGQIGDDKAVMPLISALEDKDSSVRIKAAIALGEIGNTDAVEPLIAALKDCEVQHVAAESLEKLNWKPKQDEIGAWFWSAKRDWEQCVSIGIPAVKPLAAVLHYRAYYRIKVIDALSQIGDVICVEQLVPVLKDKDRTVREKAAWALGKIGDEKAMEPLFCVLKDHSERVRLSAVVALDQLEWKPDHSEAGTWYWIAKGDWEQCAVIGVAAVQPLVDALKNEDSLVRERAALALGQIGDEMALEPLFTALEDKEKKVRKSAAKALAQIGAPAVELLISTINGVNYNVRAVAIEALSQVRDPLALDSLFAALENEKERKVREAVTISLGLIGDDRVVKPLIKMLEEKDIPEAAAEALGLSGDSRAEEPLIDALKGKKSSVREKAAWALGQIGGSNAIEPLIALLKNEREERDVRLGAGEALKQMYHHGELDSTAKSKLLAQREVIEIKFHTDEHWENEKGCVSTHSDYVKGVDL